MLKRIEIEFNHEWIKSHPALFVEELLKFQKEYSFDSYSHAVNMHRFGRIGFVAIAKNNLPAFSQPVMPAVVQPKQSLESDDWGKIHLDYVSKGGILKHE
jgi:hypothetical protein